MAVKTIGLSFKNTEDDKRLCDWIYEHSNVSGFIKDILKKAMKEEQDGSKNSEKANKKQLINLGDF